MSLGVVAPRAVVALVTLSRSVRVSITSDSESDNFRRSTGSGGLCGLPMLPGSSAESDWPTSSTVGSCSATEAVGSHDHCTLSFPARPSAGEPRSTSRDRCREDGFFVMGCCLIRGAALPLLYTECRLTASVSIDGGLGDDKASPFVGRGEYVISTAPGGETKPTRADHEVFKKAVQYMMSHGCCVVLACLTFERSPCHRVRRSMRYRNAIEWSERL